MEITGRSKSSIYPHIKNIPLSARRKLRARANTIGRLKQYALAKKGISARSYKTFEVWTPDNVRLVAHLIFDGSLPRSGCVYNSRSKVLVKDVETTMKNIYDFEPKYWQNHLTGVHRISFHNVALGAYLKTKSKELRQEIGKMPVQYKIEFLRAFFDDEGCMDFRPTTNIRRIRGYQKDVSILKLVQSLLDDIGIKSRIIIPNEVQIVGKENLLSFEEKINFSPGIYMNGSRANSRWKKHIEKQQLLRKAILSFKN